LPMGGRFQQVQVKIPRNGVAPADAAHLLPRASAAVKNGRCPAVQGQNLNDAPDTSPLLAGIPILVNPFGGVIIHAAGTHHAEDAFDVFAREACFAGDGIMPPVRQLAAMTPDLRAGSPKRSMVWNIFPPKGSGRS